MDLFYIVATARGKIDAQAEVGKTQHRVDGGADFVAHVGQELALGPCSGLGLHLGGPKRIAVRAARDAQAQHLRHFFQKIPFPAMFHVVMGQVEDDDAQHLALFHDRHVVMSMRGDAIEMDVVTMVDATGELSSLLLRRPATEALAELHPSAERQQWR